MHSEFPMIAPAYRAEGATASAAADSRALLHQVWLSVLPLTSAAGTECSTGRRPRAPGKRLFERGNLQRGGRGHRCPSPATGFGRHTGTDALDDSRATVLDF